jgi:hypothetical protein
MVVQAFAPTRLFLLRFCLEPSTLSTATVRASKYSYASATDPLHDRNESMASASHAA